MYGGNRFILWAGIKSSLGRSNLPQDSKGWYIFENLQILYLNFTLHLTVHLILRFKEAHEAALKEHTNIFLFKHMGRLILKSRKIFLAPQTVQEVKHH